ncbi:MAG: hypothetical protein AAB354_04550, partial [candidate division KSB1 bacterium]
IDRLLKSNEWLLLKKGFTRLKRNAVIPKFVFTYETRLRFIIVESVQEIAACCNHKVSYDSERNRGCTFPPHLSFSRNPFTRWRYCRVLKKIPAE